MFKKIFNFSLIFSLFLLTACNEKQIVQETNQNVDTFSILAGSEVKDMEPILNLAQEQLGFKINVSYTGTIDGVQEIQSGANFDSAWFSQSKYFYDSVEGAKKIVLSEKTMLSPVVVGITDEAAAKVSLTNKTSWKDILSFVTDKKLTYAMTDPSESNTGYVALMGISYSAANTGENLKISDINQSDLKKFFAGQKLNAGSSSWLMQNFEQSGSDFIINYESVLLNYNKSSQKPLKIIYPHEGIITADYPILLINSKKEQQYKALVKFLKSQDVQKMIVQQTNRRSINPIINQEANIFDKRILIEMPFNPDANLSEEILNAYYQDLKKPSSFALVLDTSGSMLEDNRESLMKSAINKITVGNSDVNKFAKIREREQVLVMPFSSDLYGEEKFIITQDNKVNSLSQINSKVKSLNMSGGTALFSATLSAVMKLKAEKEINNDYQYSVIVLTDGQATEGISSSEFLNRYNNLNINKGDIKVFPILFGNANEAELKMIADATGGKVFDAKNKNLNKIFKEIRSYQ